MLINILLLIVIFLSLIGIIFIISRKFFSLANIDLEQIPEEKEARMKKDLLEKKIIRQIQEWKNKLQTRKKILKVYLKTGLIFLKNKLNFIKSRIISK